MTYKSLAALFLTALLMQVAQACVPDSAKPGDCVELGTWDFSLGLGLGVRTNPLAEGDNTPLILIPQVNYNGERFSVQNLDLGMVLWEDELQQLNLLATPSFDQVYFNRWSPGNFFIESGNGFVASGGKESTGKLPVIDLDGKGNLLGPQNTQISERKLRHRRTAGLAGIEYSLGGEQLDLQLQYLGDVTGIHQGTEARVSLAQHWSFERQKLSLALGALWQSRAVTDYYYGVQPAEADELGSYSASAGLTKIARLDWRYALTPQWDLRAFASLRWLPASISSSPLIDDNKVYTVFLGGMYHF